MCRIIRMIDLYSHDWTAESLCDPPRDDLGFQGQVQTDHVWHAVPKPGALSTACFLRTNLQMGSRICCMNPARGKILFL